MSLLQFRIASSYKLNWTKLRPKVQPWWPFLQKPRINPSRTQEKFDLKFPVLTDTGNQVARQFGLVFTLDENLRPIYQSFGIDVPAHNGDQTFELPLPATYLVAADGKVLNRFVDVDYRERLAPETALAWLQAVQ